MELRKVMKENWLTHEPKVKAFNLTLFLVGFLFLSGFAYLNGIFLTDDWMGASGEKVFGQHQVWRLWTTLFAHGDLAHLFSNALLFVPFAYLLMGYFSSALFPVLGILMGGLINYLVLKTMPGTIELIGISGVVYWMGATWLTLFVLIDRRQSLRRRLGKVFFISFALFVPETYKPEVSYLSHFVGYFLGILSGTAYYFLNRREFLRAETFEWINDGEDLCPSSFLGINSQPGNGSIFQTQNEDHLVSRC